MDFSTLKKVGLTEGEVKLYTALLEIGETTRTKLAKKSGVSPSKIYDVANSLIEKGIISGVKKNGILHFSASDPNRIKDFIEEKEQDIQNEKNLIDQLLPTLLLEYQKTKEETDIEVFYGWEGMKTVYNDIATTMGKGDTNYIFGASQGADQEQTDRFFTQYTKKVKRAGYGIHIIFNEEVRKNNVRITPYYGNSPHKVRFLHTNTFAELNLYKDTSLIIMLLKKPMIIRIRNKEAYNSFKKFYDTMWNLAKP